MTFVIISGGIDLSVGSNIAVTGLLMAIMMKNWGVGVLPTLIVSLIFAGLIGLINGSFYALLSLGLAVIFGLLRVINFAHGEVYMIGSYVAFIALTLLMSGGVDSVPLLMGAAFAAKQDSPSLAAVRVVVETGKIGFPDYELFFGGGN